VRNELQELELWTIRVGRDDLAKAGGEVALGFELPHTRGPSKPTIRLGPWGRDRGDRIRAVVLAGFGHRSKRVRTILL
jgi:hypothetical protein